MPTPPGLFVTPTAPLNIVAEEDPALKQVIHQLNSHVGLVWAPNSQTLYSREGGAE